MDGDPVTVRVDAWIWSVRITKTRSAAAAACRAGHVRVNGKRAKPAQSLRIGDEVRVHHAGRERVVEVTRLVVERVGAPIAVGCLIEPFRVSGVSCSDTPHEGEGDHGIHSEPFRYPERLTDHSPPRATALVARRDRGSGRPTKRERREIDRLRGC